MSTKLSENVVITEISTPGNLTKDLNINETIKSFGAKASSWNTNTIIKIVVLVIILAFLGFNLFTYLGDIVNYFKRIFGPLFDSIAKFFGYTVGETVKQTVKVSAEGTKAGIDVVTGTVSGGVDVLEKGVGAKPRKELKEHARPNVQTPEASASLTRALADADNRVPEPDDATSVTQRTGKSGYCYIGEDRGFRSCIKVGENDTCMSGDIFPTQAICVNPSLRQ